MCVLLVFGQGCTPGSADTPQDGESLREVAGTEANVEKSSMITDQLLQLENENNQLKGQMVSIMEVIRKAVVMVEWLFYYRRVA